MPQTFERTMVFFIPSNPGKSTQTHYRYSAVSGALHQKVIIVLVNSFITIVRHRNYTSPLNLYPMKKNFKVVYDPLQTFLEPVLASYRNIVCPPHHFHLVLDEVIYGNYSGNNKEKRETV
jgi:hypothetical protein